MSRRSTSGITRQHHHKSTRRARLIAVLMSLITVSFDLFSTPAFAQVEPSETEPAASHQPGMDPETFSQRALTIATREFPTLNLKLSDKPLLFTCAGGKLSLENLYKVVKEDSERGKEDEEIRRFLKSISEINPSKATSPPIPWDDVKTRLRPQIFPSTYLKKTKKLLVARSLPFSRKLLEGFVIDSENTFQYVTHDHLKAWKIDVDQLSKCAYDNLDRASQDLKLEVVEAGGRESRGKYITISVTDGYAAARILLPDIRKRLQKDLGDPCYVAIPNRDFLIGWSPDFSHKEKFVEQVRKDFQSRHHPLTPLIYELDDANLENVSDDSVKTKSKRHRRRH